LGLGAVLIPPIKNPRIDDEQEAPYPLDVVKLPKSCAFAKDAIVTYSIVSLYAGPEVAPKSALVSLAHADGLCVSVKFDPLSVEFPVDANVMICISCINEGSLPPANIPRVLDPVAPILYLTALKSPKS
jgi:hypothetical protein